MENIKQLITAIANGKTLEIDESFAEVFSSKVSQKIDALRKDISENLFVVKEDKFASKLDELKPYHDLHNDSGKAANDNRKQVTKILSLFDKAENAKNKSDYHRHMSKAHEMSGDWHDVAGQSDMVQPNYEESEKHANAYQKLTGKKLQESEQLDESVLSGTKLVKKYGDEANRAEVRYNPEYEEYQVHHYKDGKHAGEGPVSYHGNDKQDAHDTAKSCVAKQG